MIASLQRRYQTFFAGRTPVSFAVVPGPGAAPHTFGPDAPVYTISVLDERGAKALASLDQLGVAVSYLNGWLDVDGDLITALKMRDFLRDFHPVAWASQFLPALIRGKREHDRRSISAHYDEDSDFFLTFLDTRHRCYTEGVFAYDDRLQLLPFYLQQLEMESNGKSVTVTGDPADHPTAPVTWGGTGTDAQHAVFQLLHQGTVLVPVEFVAVGENDDAQDPDRHRQLLLNAFAQGAALMQGQANDDPQRAYPGNRPSATILVDRLDARTLGALVAFYEHRTFANAVLLGINPFDQFGVELGKQMARQLSDGADEASLDPSTRALIERAGV